MAVNYISTTHLNVALFVDGQLCAHDQIETTFISISQIRIGEGLRGLISKFALFKAVMGLESFPNYRKGKVLLTQIPVLFPSIIT